MNAEPTTTRQSGISFAFLAHDFQRNRQVSMRHEDMVLDVLADSLAEVL